MTFLKRVTERSPTLRALDERQRAAAAQVGVAGVLPNPTLSYERESVAGTDSHDNFIRLAWMVDVSGRLGLGIAAARAGADAERFAAERDAWELRLDAREAFLEALYARDRLARLDEARESLAKVVDVLRSRASQGDASSYDVDRAALELDSLDDERASARRTLQSARLRLGVFVGEPTKAYDAVGVLALPAKPDGGGAVAIERRDVDAARARAQQSEQESEAAERRWIPRLELMGGMMVSRSMGSEGVGYVVGVGGDLPVFDRGGAAASRARAEAVRWRREADAIANDARGDAERARQDLVMRIEQAESYIAGPAARATDLVRRAGVAYREGDRPILEVLDVQRTAQRAALRSLELIVEARRAELSLWRARGRQP